MPIRAGRLPPRAWPDLTPDPGSLRAWLDLNQAEMATAVGVTVNTWARWERGELAIHPAYQLLLGYVEVRTDRAGDRAAARLRARRSPQPLLTRPTRFNFTSVTP